MKETLAALYALQQLDTALDAIKRAMSALDPGKNERANYESAKLAHTQAEQKLHSVQADVRDTELEQKSVEEKRAHEEKRLYGGSVRNPKELQALQEEVDMLARQRARLDEKLLGLMEALAEAKNVEKEARHTLKSTAVLLKAKQEEYRQKGEELTQQGRDIFAQRKQAQANTAADILQLYEKTRAAHGGIAVTSIIEGNICDGCRMKIPGSLMVHIREATKIVYCDNCRRILVRV